MQSKIADAVSNCRTHLKICNKYLCFEVQYVLYEDRQYTTHHYLVMILEKIIQFSINEGDIILTYLQDCPRQVLQLGLSGFLLVAHEVVGTGLDLPSGI